MRQPEALSFPRFGVWLIAAVYLAIGILGFVPVDAVNPPSPHTSGTHYLLRHFAVNPLHNLIHLGIGLSGLWLGRRREGVAAWGLGVGSVLVALAIVGLGQAVLEGLPLDQLLLGILPLNSPGHMFHLVTGGFAVYLGLIASRSAPAAGPASSLDTPAAALRSSRGSRG